MSERFKCMFHVEHCCDENPMGAMFHVEHFVTHSGLNTQLVSDLFHVEQISVVHERSGTKLGLLCTLSNSN